MKFSTWEPQNLINHSPKYEKMMTMNFNRGSDTKMESPLKEFLWALCKIFYVFFVQNKLTCDLSFNLRTLGWFLLNFKNLENKTSKKSENHHSDT